MPRGRSWRLLAAAMVLSLFVVACSEFQFPPLGGPPHEHLPAPPPDDGPPSDDLPPAPLPPSPPPSEDPAPEAPPTPTLPTPTRLWSEAAGWPGGVLPAVGDEVTIPHGDVVLLDVSPPPLAGLAVNGVLIFDEANLELTADWIMVHGGLYVGSSQQPFQHNAVITLTGPWSDDPGMEFMGTKVLGAMHGGRIELHGIVDGPSWTRLMQHTAVGDTVIQVEDARGWQVGDRIVLASTDFEMFEGGNHQGDHRRRDSQVEERTITAVADKTLTLDRPLSHPRVGQTEMIAGVLIDQRAEVARLTRNVIVQGDAASADPGNSDYFRFGGHVMVMQGSVGIFEGVEFRRLGQIGMLARYPVHFHMLRDGGADSYVGSSSIHSSFHRCLTIHGTNLLRVYDVAAYDTYGHCFFFEDAAEEGNLLQRNLALMIRKPPENQRVLMSDTHHLGPAAFWVTNPANDLIGNVAASSAGTGFWYALPPRPTGLFRAIYGDDGEGIRPQTTPLGRFEDNVAHSNAQVGLHVDNGPTLDLSGVPATSYRPRSDPLRSNSDPVTAVFENLVAYKNRNAAAWFRGDNTVLRGGVLSDNGVGVTFASNTSWAQDVSFVGETSNLGHPRFWEDTGLDGRTLPRFWDPAFVIRGYEFYDGDVHVFDSFFARYAPNEQRQAAAISYKDFTDWPVSPLNSASGLRFENGTNRVYLATREVGGNIREDGYRSAVFRDLDGSITGAPDRMVSVDNPFMLYGDCTQRADWNAWVCRGRYASLTLVDVPSSATGLGPVSITRSNGDTHVMGGMPDRDPRGRFRTLLRLGDSYRYDFTGSSDHLQVHLYDIGPDDRMVVSLPYTGGTPFIYRDWWVDSRNLLKEFDSLSAFQDTQDPGFYNGGGRLHLRLVQQGGNSWAQVEICRVQLCGR